MPVKLKFGKAVYTNHNKGLGVAGHGAKFCSSSSAMLRFSSYFNKVVTVCQMLSLMLNLLIYFSLDLTTFGCFGCSKM